MFSEAADRHPNTDMTRQDRASMFFRPNLESANVARPNPPMRQPKQTTDNWSRALEGPLGYGGCARGGIPRPRGLGQAAHVGFDLARFCATPFGEGVGEDGDEVLLCIEKPRERDKGKM
ncbi:single-stranded DNA-binding protein [Striga asiatica]|uniref:Single-stranded DNA-binding protein n=1 Tax=Striga asiatica TaxID=4170 RepID=A0A5A7PXF0_STRAF|nr:single-stranded DNA-binding protein [Striga asiatica]